jgi:hypothetical protein
MDISMEEKLSRNTGNRTRRQRKFTDMAKYTTTILKLAEELFMAYKEQFNKYNIGAKAISKTK